MNLPFAELKRQRRGLVFTYGLTAVENIFDLLYPFTIGLAINGLVAGDHKQLLPLIVVWLAHITISYWRQRFDSRLFTRIYAAVAAKLAIKQRSQAISTSEIAARTDMVEELVEFMEHDVPEAVLALFALVGGVALLFWYDWIAGAIMALILPPTLFVYLRFGRRARQLEGRFNDQSEDEVDLIESGSAEALGGISRSCLNTVSAYLMRKPIPGR